MIYIYILRYIRLYIDIFVLFRYRFMVFRYIFYEDLKLYRFRDIFYIDFL